MIDHDSRAEQFHRLRPSPTGIPPARCAAPPDHQRNAVGGGASTGISERFRPTVPAMAIPVLLFTRRPAPSRPDVRKTGTAMAAAIRGTSADSRSSACSRAAASAAAFCSARFLAPRTASTMSAITTAATTNSLGRSPAHSHSDPEGQRHDSSAYGAGHPDWSAAPGMRDPAP